MRIFSFICLLLISFLLKAQEYNYPYSFFYNSLMDDNYFFSQTSASGSSFIQHLNNKLPVADSLFHTPGNALKLHYKNGKGGKWQANIYRQQKRGVDNFQIAKYLSFWIYISTSESNNKGFPSLRFINGDSSFSNNISINAAKLKAWNQVLIPTDALYNFDADKPDSIIGIAFAQSNEDGKEYVVYLDDIEFLATENSPAMLDKAVIASATGYALHNDIVWNKPTHNSIHLVKIYRSENGKDFIPVGIQQPFINRYADFTGETNKQYSYKISFLNSSYKESALSPAIQVATRSMTDDEMLTMVQEAAFRYYWEGAESFSGLAKENIPGRHNMIASGASGFGIMALIAGAERKFIARTQFVERMEKIVLFLEKAKTFHGAYPHFIDGPTGNVEPFFGKRDNGADLVETSFLMQGLLAARQYFSGDNEQEKRIREKITTIWEKVEWDWFKQYPDSKFLYWHWSPDQAWTINHNLIGWNETMVTYLLAIASPTHAVPASMYYSGWANQDSTGQKYRSAWGQTNDGSMYRNGNTYFGIKLDVGVSNGGPLFFTHYSYLGYDPRAITDRYTNYFTNNQNIAKINHAYCMANPKKYAGYGDSAWGLTASDGPFNYSADEPVEWQDHGKIAPTGAISSFPYTPVESMKALKHYYYRYGKFLWGEYGFRDAFDLTNNWCSEIYMGLNQAPMTVMIENYRTGLIWDLFMRNPEIKQGLLDMELEKNK